MKQFYILFDFDGVIADSFSVAFEVNKMVCPHLTENGYKKRFEGNINDWEKNDEKHTNKCRHNIDFFKEYVPRMKNSVTVVSGMKEILEELSKTYNLIIISSTITEPIKEFMNKYGLEKYFIEIIGNDIHTSKVEKIKMVFEKYNICSEMCVFVTDTLGDIREAKQVMVDSIAVSWGYHEKNTILSGGPLKIVDKTEDLIAVISDYFKFK